MSRLDNLTAILQAEIALDRWDAAPSVGLMAEFQGEFRLVPVELSESFWEMADPATMLEVMARALVDPQRPALAILPVRWPEGFALTGIALFTEGWGIDLTGLPPKVKAQALKLSETRELSTHPNRIEIKMIAAEDIDGARYSTQYRRGASAPSQITEDAKGAQLSGRVFDGLHTILQALVITQELHPKTS